MDIVNPDILAQSLTYLHGKVDPKKLTLYTPIRDEMYFLPSFLKHYRTIGIEQFLLIDDGSIDGSTDYLAAQPDCVVIRLPYQFGQYIKFEHPNRMPVKGRAGILMKNEIPNFLLKNKYVIYVDADEFLFLPPGINSIHTIIERLRNEGDTSVSASVVEFFPSKVSDIEKNFQPNSLADLISEYPLIESNKILELRKDLQPKRVGDSKTKKLVKQYFYKDQYFLSSFFNFFDTKFKKMGSPHLKTPIVLHNENNYRVGSHNAFQPPSSKIMLTIGHFVFTSNFNSKIKRATTLKTHAKNSSKYFMYKELIKRIKMENGSFLSSSSVNYIDENQLIEFELMKW